MELFLEAEPGEIEARGEALIHRLADLVGPFNRDLEDALHKALPAKESDLKYKVLQELKKNTAEAYQALLDAMVSDIGKVLDQAAKSTTFQKAAGMPPPTKDEDEEDEPEEDEEPLEPGDYDPKTDEIVPEPEEEDEEGEEEETEKAEGYDPSASIVESDEEKYERVKNTLVAMGYRASDFGEGGPFYGWSVNELIEFVRDREK